MKKEDLEAFIASTPSWLVELANEYPSSFTEQEEPKRPKLQLVNLED